MGFQLAEFAEKRPVAYHVTRRENLVAIREYRALYSARRLLTLAGREDLLQCQRRGDVTLQLGVHSVMVRDQDRLVRGSLVLASGLSLEDYIAYLNRWIYFWPGDRQAPAGRARGIAAATGERNVAIIRVPVVALFSENPGSPPAFASVNSGAARHHSGRPVKRDLNVHRRAGLFRDKATDVIEMVVEDEARLPSGTEVAFSLSGPWREL